MISAPHVQPGVVDSPVNLIDVAPTILDFLGIPIPASFEGTSLYPSLRGDPPQSRDVFAEAGYAVDFQKVLIRWPWKLIHIPDPIVQELAHGKEFELYNLEEDPAEVDEAGERHPERLEAMRDDLRRWVASWSDDITEPDEAEADPEVLESLRALGYVE
jgi:arylsulfatase A-like enzyme